MNGILCWAVDLYRLILLLYVVFQYVPKPPAAIGPLVQLADALVLPILRPIDRKIKPIPVGNVQIGVGIIIMFFGLSILRSLIC